MNLKSRNFTSHQREGDAGGRAGLVVSAGPHPRHGLRHLHEHQPRQALPQRSQVLRFQLEVTVPAELTGRGAAAVAGMVRSAAREHHLEE